MEEQSGQRVLEAKATLANKTKSEKELMPNALLTLLGEVQIVLKKRHPNGLRMAGEWPGLC
jgi:hypothetical protein